MEQESSTQTHPFKFSGNAREYFGIWFVNSTLTTLTLGIYSAWAKVRNLQYFYGNTELAGGSFQFTADPVKILRSRLFAFALFVAYVFVEQLDSSAADYAYAGFILLFILLIPVLSIFVLTFRLRYSAWRGIAFHFHRNYREAYRVYLMPATLATLTMATLMLPFNSPEVDAFLGIDPPQEMQMEPPAVDEASGEESLSQEDDDAAEDNGYINGYLFIPSATFLLFFFALIPYFDFINVRFIARNASFGTSRFTYSAGASDYYAMYWPWILATLGIAALWLLALATDHIDFDGLYTTLALVSLLYYSGSLAYFKSQRYNLLLDNMSIERRQIRLKANVPFLALFSLLMVNSIAVTLSLGLMGPWAKVRAARFLLRHTELVADISLDQFIARQVEERDAIGEEIADIFDLEAVG